MSAIATISLRNHTRDLAVKYTLYEYLEYFKDDPEMLSIITGASPGGIADSSRNAGTTTTTTTKEGTSSEGEHGSSLRSEKETAYTDSDLLTFFTPTNANLEYATPLQVKVNNIMAELGDEAAKDIPHEKKNKYKPNPFEKIDESEINHSPEIFRIHPSLTFYSIICSALDVENAEKVKKDRGSLGLSVASAWDGKEMHGPKFNSLNSFIATPLLNDYRGILTEYGFAANTDEEIYDENGKVKSQYICGEDRANCEVDFNKELFSKISPDDYFEEQKSILCRKLIILPVLRLLEKHRNGEITHTSSGAVTVDDLRNAKTRPRIELAKEAFLKVFMSIETPKIEQTEDVLEMFCYIQDKLNSV